MKSFILFLTLPLLIGCQRSGSSIELFKLESKIFNNTRTLKIYLPPNYSETNDYPLLLLNDGQNVFGGEGIQSNDDWKVDEIVDSLIDNKIIPEIVIVAIDNMGSSERGNEFLPWPDEFLYPPNPDPLGKKYPNFLIGEVIPLIKSNFSIQEGKENIGIGGFSYGGLISVYAGMMHPDKFGYILAETPSLYVNNRIIFQVAKDSVVAWPGKVYMGVGTNELGLNNCEEYNEDNLMAVEDVMAMSETINDLSPETLVKVNVAKCAVHSFAEASNRLPEALTFLLNQNK